MSFVRLVVKNLLRQRARAALTLLGISIGITTVVALGVITGGLKKAAGEIINIGGADFMVGQKGAADLSFSTVTEEEWAAIAALPDVERAQGALFHITQAAGQPFFVVIGARAENIAGNPPPLTAGALLEPGAADQILLGSNAAKTLKAGVGDRVTIDDTSFTVRGIFRTGRLYEDGGVYAPLETVQRMTSKGDVVTVVHVKVRAGVDPATVAAAIEERFGSLTTISSVEEYGEIDQGITFIDAANMAISVLAVGIGAIGVMNTMVMSVFERTREIGILRAVGWSGARVLRMIVLESLVLCLLAAAAGSALGVVLGGLVTKVPAVAGLIRPQYELGIFVRALLVAGLVALIGAAYPALRAVRLTPMEALRHE